VRDEPLFEQTSDWLRITDERRARVDTTEPEMMREFDT
jgi:hypothetical protein